MKKVRVEHTGLLTSVETFEGEYLEQKIERIMQNGEPITDGAPIIFTEKKDGVLPAYNIRTERFEIAIEAMDKVQAIKAAKKDIAVDVADVPDKLEGGTPSEN
nr:MAG TPA: hypothetical protein [Microviridae sp.]